MPVLKKSKTSCRYQVSFLKPLFLSCLTVSPQNKSAPRAGCKNRYRSASLTAEAALVFPVFFFAIYMFWQCFLLVLFQMSVCHEVSGAAMKYAHLGYPERKAEEEQVNLSWLYQPLLWNAAPENDRVEQMLVLCIPEEDGSIRVDISYKFICEAVFFVRMELPVQQTLRFYPYLGKTDPDLFSEIPAEQTADIVYMTEHGSVYHESRACVYLNVTVRKVAAEGVGQERNSSGGRYTECSRCQEDAGGSWVYISAGGNRYHWSLECPSIKRTVLEKSREEVTGVPACHKCGAREETE